MNILLIEDETKVADMIKRGLEEHNHQVTIVHDGLTGYEKAVDLDFDLVVLDAVLPKLAGLDVCKLIRRFKNGMPILMLTAVNSIAEKVLAFDYGVDDYLTKPFHFEELVARVSALGRRNYVVKQSRNYEIADLNMDLNSKRIFRAGKEIILSVKEYQLLEMLITHKNSIVSREDISKEIWGVEYVRERNVIDVFINLLRAKIDKGHNKQLIHTVIGLGYILKENG